MYLTQVCVRRLFLEEREAKTRRTLFRSLKWSACNFGFFVRVTYELAIPCVCFEKSTGRREDIGMILCAVRVLLCVM